MFRSDIHALKHGNTERSTDYFVCLFYTFVLLDGLASPWVLPIAAVPSERGSPAVSIGSRRPGNCRIQDTAKNSFIAECRSPFEVRCVFYVTAPCGIQDVCVTGASPADVGGFLSCLNNVECLRILSASRVLLSILVIYVMALQGGGLTVIKCWA